VLIERLKWLVLCDTKKVKIFRMEQCMLFCSSIMISIKLASIHILLSLGNRIENTRCPQLLPQEYLILPQNREKLYHSCVQASSRARFRGKRVSHRVHRIQEKGTNVQEFPAQQVGVLKSHTSL